MLALFEVLSFKGWLDVRDVLIKALGPVSHKKMKIGRQKHMHFPNRFTRSTSTFTSSWAAWLGWPFSWVWWSQTTRRTRAPPFWPWTNADGERDNFFRVQYEKRAANFNKNGRTGVTWRRDWKSRSRCTCRRGQTGKSSELLRTTSPSTCTLKGSSPAWYFWTAVSSASR